MEKTEKNPRKYLISRYAFAITAVSFLVVVSGLAVFFGLKSEINSDVVVDMSGRQRMLSQKITKEALFVQEVKEGKISPANHSEELKKAVQDWEKAHTFLMNNGDNNTRVENTPEIMRLYVEQRPHYFEILESAKRLIALEAQEYDQVTKNQFEENIFIIRSHEGDFLVLMEKIVGLYAASSKDSINKLLVLQLVFIFAIMATIFFISIGIMRPAAKKIGDYFDAERAANKSKNDFVSIASHQLKTPLTSINWHIELLLNGSSGKVSKQQREYLSEVYHSSRRMVKLVNNLLNVSRIETGRLKIDPVETDLNVLVKEAVNEVVISKKDKKVEVILPNEAIVAEIDQNLYLQIIRNLVDNAVKYSGDNAKVNVTLGLDELENILLTVKDNGIGIPVGEQLKIFQKFFRADNAMMSETDGNGLGLFFVKMITELSGGKIRFKSMEGKGTEFFVTFPRSGMIKKEGEKSFIS